MSFEVVAILFNFHHWTCVVGELALAMTRTKVESCFGLCSQRGGPKLDFSNAVSRCYFPSHFAIQLQ